MRKKRTRDHSSKNVQKQSPGTVEIETQTNLNDTRYNVLLQTAVANVYLSDKSESRAFRLLFDSSAQLSYVSPKVKAFLNPEIKAKKEVVLNTFGENTSTKLLEVVELVVASKTADDDVKLQAFVIDICHPLKNQNTKFAKKNFSHIRNLTLSDENCFKSSDIDILIGSDYYWHFMKNRIIRGNADKSVALETKLGYVLSEKLDIGSNGRHQINLNEFLVTNVLSVQQDLMDPKEQLNEIVQKFWNLESVGVSKNEFDVCENFEADISLANNRYEVKLPFISEHGMLDDNFLLCKSRLKNLFNGKFRKDPGLFKRCNEIIKDQIESTIIEKEPESHIVGETHYLPHKPVVRDEKATAKLRIVFEASAETNGSHSLNDCLYLGPSLTATLFGVLLRFLIHNIAFVGDIEKAFLQIGLHPSIRDFVRFLWFQEPSNIDFEKFENNELTELRFCGVLFGVTSSPFLLFDTIIHHMNKYSTVDKEFVDIFLSPLHVDDLSTGANSVDEAFDFFL